MKNRSKMILGLASLLGVTAGATAVSGFAWFVTTKTASIDVTNIGIYNNNPSLSVSVSNLHGVNRTNAAANDFNLEAAKDTTKFNEMATGDGSKTAFTLTGSPVAGATPSAYVDGVLDSTATYDAGNKTVTFTTAPANGSKIVFAYCDSAALTDVSSTDGVHVYDPTWQVAAEGKKATKIPAAVAGEQYISFDLVFAAPSTGSLKIFLDRPTITAKSSSEADDVEAAAVSRVAFSKEGANILTLGNNVSAEYNKGLSQAKVENIDGAGKNANTTDGDYTIADAIDACENLYVPTTENYSIRSSAPTADAEHMYLGDVTSAAPVTISVAIWLEGTSHVDDKGNNSDPIGGEINVSLPIVAFGA